MISSALPEIPATLRRYARLIGDEPALRLSWKCGGRRMRMHRGVPNPEIEDALGREAALKIAAHFHNSQIKVPLCTQTIIVYLMLQGWPQPSIVGELRCDESHVRNTISAWRAKRRSSAKS